MQALTHCLWCVWSAQAGRAGAALGASLTVDRCPSRLLPNSTAVSGRILARVVPGWLALRTPCSNLGLARLCRNGRTGRRYGARRGSQRRWRRFLRRSRRLPTARKVRTHVAHASRALVRGLDGDQDYISVPHVPVSPCIVAQKRSASTLEYSVWLFTGALTAAVRDPAVRCLPCKCRKCCFGVYKSGFWNTIEAHTRAEKRISTALRQRRITRRAQPMRITCGAARARTMATQAWQACRTRTPRSWAQMLRRPIP